MKGMTITKAAEICGGRLNCRPEKDVELGKVVIDSRAVEAGDFFVAYKGERVDGNDYVTAALDKGAACCLASRLPAGETRPVILVPDVQKALELICAEFRRGLNIPVIGITGSVGKTTAKEMIASVLSQRCNVLKTDGNLNNQIGVPMTISRIEPQHEAAVVEMGISGFGEMSELARVARPTVAVFTVIGHAHLEFLHDQDGVYRAKTEMLDFMPPDAPAIVNGDDERLFKMPRENLITCGMGEGCALRAENIRSDGKAELFDIVYQGRRIPVAVPAYGRHMITAALEGAAVGFVLGLSDEQVAAGIAGYKILGRRGIVTDTGRISIVDDSYNANPDSMRSSIDSLAELPGRKLCILGDMLEMGQDAPKMHCDLGAYAAKKGMSVVLCCGELSKETARGAGKLGRHYSSVEELIAALPGVIRTGDRVLVKASRGMHFERIAEALKEL